MRYSRALAGLALFLGLLNASAHADTGPAEKTVAERCEGLAGGRFNLLPSAPTQIVSATIVAASDKQRAHCEVQGYVNPTINFGMLLPTENWNGKYIVRGCGGSCGNVATQLACASHLRDGYACLTTDMGHRSTQLDNVWTYNNLQGQVDFGYRSTHVTAMAGKAIVEAFYGSAAKLSYFMACSTGGRQAMVEAQRFPDDFDGIVAVAPAAMGPFTGGKPLNTDPATFNRADDGRAILPNRKIPMIHRAVVALCDMNDGVKDGLIGDPRACHFDPGKLLCKGSDAQDCLTAPQIEVVKKIYELRHAAIGSELNWINYYIFDTYPAPTENPYASRGDRVIVETLDNPGNPDLRGFKNHGGKLIMAHGWADPSVPPGPTVEYYELATRTMGGPEATQAFYRLFMVPGMSHCSGGEGAYGIRYLNALENWVEHGQAPDKLIGKNPNPTANFDFFGNDIADVKAEDVAYSRPFFPYPKQSVYSGKGDPKDAGSYVAK